MTALAWLVPAALALGALGLGAFLWSLHTGQFEDLEGAGWRALDDETSTEDQGTSSTVASCGSWMERERRT